MKTRLLFPLLSLLLLGAALLVPVGSRGQCSNLVSDGVNLVTNGDFSDGFNDWEFDEYNPGSYTYTPGQQCPSSGGEYCRFDWDNIAACQTAPSSCFSNNGRFIWAGAESYYFNQSFIAGGSNFPGMGTPEYIPLADHTPTSDNMMLMIDGSCTAGIDAWRQNVTGLVIGETYYFSAWIMPLNGATTSGQPANLRFEINGLQVGTTITTLGGTAGTWQFFETTWVADATTATIALQNVTTTGCGTGVDFALDDIYFAPNCGANQPGPVPDLGGTVSLCGGDGTITLGPGVSAAVLADPGTTYEWNTGETTPTLTVSGVGTYTLCVDSNEIGSCKKSAQVTVINTYNIDLATPIEICEPASVVLNPGHGGPRVGFEWRRDGVLLPGETGQTLTATVAGSYEVTVVDTTCGTQTETSVITAQTSATPNDVFVCPSPSDVANLSVTGTGTYTWWNAETGGTQVHGPATTYSPTVTADTTTFWVEDASVYRTEVGYENWDVSTGGPNQTQLTQYYMIFEAKQPLTIDSVDIYLFMNNNNPGDAVQFRFQLYDDPSNSNSAPSTVGGTSAQYTATNATARFVSTPWPGLASQRYGIRVPVGLSVATPGTYRLGAVNTSTGNVYIANNLGGYVYNDDATGGNIITINSSKLGTNPWSTTLYGGMFDWQVSYQNACARVPVRAIENCPLPVEWLGFQVAREGEGALLTWQTAFEDNASHFVVERSVDGSSFEAIGTVSAIGSSTDVTNYDFWDPVLPDATVIYYRLRQLDFDGAEDFSPIRTLTRESNSQILVMPNPVSQGGSLTISVPTAPGLATDVLLFDMLGRVVHSRSLASDESSTSFELSTSSLSEGAYVLRAVTEGKVLQTKIIVTR